LTGPSHDSVAQTRTGSVTQVNLENYGWRPLPRVREWVGFGSQQVSIDHEGRILVGFTERENTSLATRNDPGLSFHILRFTSDGKVDLSLALPTNNLFNNGLYLGPEDQLFARANETFQVLSEENGTGTEVAAWRPLAPCTRECQISQSPSRRTLMVTKWEGHDEYTHILFDVSSSPPRVVENCLRTGGPSTDKFTYYSGSIGTHYFARRSPICDGDHSVELPLDKQAVVLRALNDESFLLLGFGKLQHIELVTVDGQVKFRQEMPKHDFVTTGEVKVDERGDRFAFVVDTWRGGSRPLDISGNRVGRRIVADTETGRQLSTVPVNPVDHSEFDFSISPDGHRLAILDEGVVTAVDLE